MSIYVTKDDIPDTKNLSDAAIEMLLNSCEAMIHYACQDIFYEKDAVYKFTGDDSMYHFVAKRPYIIEIEKIDFTDIDGTSDEIDSSYYILSESFLITRISGNWERGLPFNYHVTCTMGRSESDEFYKPDAIKLAIIALATNILDEYYEEATGTGSSIISTPVYKFSSESITNYSYTLKNMQQINLDSKTPFGIPYIDNLISPYRNKSLNVSVVSSIPSSSRIAEIFL